MTPRTPLISAGLLVYRYVDCAEPRDVEVLIVHPGGPLWARKDDGAWSIPKGLVEPDEDHLPAARREFAEELGQNPPDGAVIALGEVRLKSGKRVVAFAVEGTLDVSDVVSNTFEMPWPPRSGRLQRFPEVDRAQWSTPDDARRKLNPAQAGLVDRLVDALRAETR
ncbi:NUDIX domain-containing protein [Gordonia sp. DT219]|uniref:NUDIX domain-containing protein n=1 Tax=Gordonia sp. DT219 TaxID=3416658 RepID=UPI003CF358A6